MKIKLRQKKHARSALIAVGGAMMLSINWSCANTTETEAPETKAPMKANPSHPGSLIQPGLTAQPNSSAPPGNSTLPGSVSNQQPPGQQSSGGKDSTDFKVMLNGAMSLREIRFLDQKKPHRMARPGQMFLICLVSVRRITSTPAHIGASDIYMTGSDGNVYSPLTLEPITDAIILGATVQPGSIVTGGVVYEAPASVHPTTLEFRQHN